MYPGGAKEPAGHCRRLRDLGLIPGSGRSPGGGHGNPLQYYCLENPMDRGAWWDTVHGVAKSQTCLKQLSTHTYMQWIVRIIIIIYFLNYMLAIDKCSNLDDFI